MKSGETIPLSTFLSQLSSLSCYKPTMIQLFDADSKQQIGSISEEQLAFLRKQMEEESLEDQDYYINTATIDMFESAGADAGLLDLLRSAMNGREEMTILWQS